MTWEVDKPLPSCLPCLVIRYPPCSMFLKTLWLISKNVVVIIAFQDYQFPLKIPWLISRWCWSMKSSAISPLVETSPRCVFAAWLVVLFLNYVFSVHYKCSLGILWSSCRWWKFIFSIEKSNANFGVVITHSLITWLLF